MPPPVVNEPSSSEMSIFIHVSGPNRPMFLSRSLSSESCAENTANDIKDNDTAKTNAIEYFFEFMPLTRTVNTSAIDFNLALKNNHAAGI